MLKLLTESLVLFCAFTLLTATLCAAVLSARITRREDEQAHEERKHKAA